jgi:hypothetical protein
MTRLSPSTTAMIQEALGRVFDARYQARQAALAAQIAAEEASSAAVAESEAKKAAAELLVEAGFSDKAGEHGNAFTYRGAAWWVDTAYSVHSIKRVDLPQLPPLDGEDLQF